VEISLSGEQEFFRDTTRRFLATECPTTTIRELTTDPRGWTPDYWSRGAELGWTCLLVPEHAGGGSLSGAGVIDLSIVAEAFGRHASPGPLLPVNVVADAIARRGSDGQRAELLPGLLSGESVATWCGAEHAIADGSGSLRAAARNESIELSGVSSPVEAASHSDHLLVTAMSDEGLVQVIVERRAAGVRVQPLKGVDSVRRFDRVSFDRVTVPPDALLGRGSATDDVERQLQVALVIQLAEMVGAAEVAFDFTLQSTARVVPGDQAPLRRHEDVAGGFARLGHSGRPGRRVRASGRCVHRERRQGVCRPVPHLADAGLRSAPRWDRTHDRP
jgi:alkylation response protein AidB-like acyl-CoA dehydrogenase